MNEDSAPHSALHKWLLASRPATLTAAAAPVLVGSAVAAQEQELRLLPLLVTLLGAFFLQIASNFANDVFDFEKGADTHERLGPTRAVQAGLLTATQMRRGLWLVIALAVVCGVYLTVVAGWPILVIGLLSIVSAIAYTGGPYPLGYNGLGDVFVMLFFGIIAVCGTTFVQLGRVTELSFVSSLVVGALITNILVVNNLRDRHQDRVVGKRTLAVRWGRGGALTEYALLYLFAYLVPVFLWISGRLGLWAALPLLSLPLAMINWRGVVKCEGRELNAVLVSTAKLVFIFGLLFATGIFLDAKGV